MSIQKSIFACILSSALAFGADDSFDDLLGLSLEELMNVPVITATKNLKPLSKVSSTVRIITAKDIKRYGYMTLEEALSDLPGFQFRNLNGFNTYTFMRGAPSQNNLILLKIDGVAMNEISSGGFYGGLQHNLANVKRIEVVYGPSSVLYGTNAISGVINIITYSPEDYKEMGSSIGAAAGSFDTRLAEFRTGYYDSEKEYGFTLSGRYVYSEKADLGGAQGDYNWADSMQNYERSREIEGKFSYKDLDMGFVYQNKQSSNTTSYKTISTKYQDSGSLWDISFLNLWGRLNSEFTRDLQLSSLVYYRDATVNDNTVFAITTDNGQEGTYRPNSLWGVEEKLNYTFTQGQALVLGLVFEQERVAESFSDTVSGSIFIPPARPQRPNMLKNDLLSLYIQGEHEITDNIELTLGLRYDDSDYYGRLTTPRAALVYSTDKTTSRFSYSEGYRAPRPWDYTSGNFSNPGLLPEEMKSYEISFDYLLNENWYSSLSLYNNTIINKLTSSSTGWINSGFLKTKGAEVTLKYLYDEFETYVNYTYTRSENEQGITELEISKHTANMGANYKFNRHYAASLKANYIGSRPNKHLITTTNSMEVEEALVVNAQLSYYDFHKWDFHLQLKNAADEEYYHPSNRSTVQRYRQPQRAALLYTRYKF